MRGRRFRPAVPPSTGAVPNGGRGGIGRVSARLTASARAPTIGRCECGCSGRWRSTRPPGSRRRGTGWCSTPWRSGGASPSPQKVSRTRSGRRAGPRPGPRSSKAASAGSGRRWARPPSRRRIAATGWYLAGSSWTGTSSSRWWSRDASTSTQDLRSERCRPSTGRSGCGGATRSPSCWTGCPGGWRRPGSTSSVEVPRRICCRRGWTPACTTTSCPRRSCWRASSPGASAAGSCSRSRSTAAAASGTRWPRSGLPGGRSATSSVSTRVPGWSSWSGPSCPRTRPWRRTTTPARRAARARGWAWCPTTTSTATRSSAARRT